MEKQDSPSGTFEIVNIDGPGDLSLRALGHVDIRMVLTSRGECTLLDWIPFISLLGAVWLENTVRITIS